MAKGHRSRLIQEAMSTLEDIEDEEKKDDDFEKRIRKTKSTTNRNGEFKNESRKHGGHEWRDCELNPANRNRIRGNDETRNQQHRGRHEANFHEKSRVTFKDRSPSADSSRTADSY